MPQFTYVTTMISDEQAIANLMYRYAESIDDGRLEDAAALFERATVPMGSRDFDHEALLELWRSLIIIHPDGTPRTVHQTTNLIIEVAPDGRSASARSRFTVLQATDTLPLQPICSGRYSDTFVKSDGAWHFASRRYAMPFVGDTSQHMRNSSRP